MHFILPQNIMIPVSFPFTDVKDSGNKLAKKNEEISYVWYFLIW